MHLREEDDLKAGDRLGQRRERKVYRVRAPSRRKRINRFRVRGRGCRPIVALPTVTRRARSRLAGAVLALGGSSVVGKVSTGGNPCGVAGAAGFVWVTDAASAEL
jgi:hypothetical protein